MPARKQTQTLEPSAESSPQINDSQIHGPKMSLYERTREERIKANLKKMQSLGIMDLSLKLKSQTPAKRTRRNSYSGSKCTDNISLAFSCGSLRRSSRLQNVTPVSYCEVVLTKEDRDHKVFKIKDGSKPEVYTEEHEKLLGSTERSWTFFVDGYGDDGRRIYDPVKGKTCHQCRQKTLGHRSHCSQCHMVQGQFCGDCLYMRYGEHVLEALENPDWICPVCRGICNCSLCRNAKGWLPTGPIYRKVSSLGFKSVAHYLIQTKRAQPNSEEPDTANQFSAKRSLSFPATEALSEEPLQADDNLLVMSKPQPEDKQDANDLKRQGENKMESNPDLSAADPISARRSLLFSHAEREYENREAPEVIVEIHEDLKLSEPQFGDKKDNMIKDEKEEELTLTEKEHDSAKPGGKRRLSIEPSPESIGGRLRQRRGENNGYLGEKLQEVNEEVMHAMQAVKNILPDKKVQKDDLHFPRNMHESGDITSDSSPKLEKKTALAAQPSPDSIAGRLRQRRLEAKVSDNGHSWLRGTRKHQVLS